MDLFSYQWFQVTITKFGIKSTHPPSIKFETEIVYKINKMHTSSVYKSEGRLHEQTDSLCFPQNRMHRYKLIDEIYQETNKDLFNNIYGELSKKAGVVASSPTKKKVISESCEPSPNKSFISKVRDKSFDSVLKNKKQKSLNKSGLRDYESEDENSKSGFIKFNNKLKTKNKKIDKEAVKEATMNLIPQRVLERPTIKTFNSTNKVNHYRMRSSNMIEKITAFLGNQGPIRPFQTTSDLKYNKEKSFVKNKKDLVEILEKNNQKYEVLMEKKLHYFYKQKRNLDDNEDVEDYHLNLGKITAEDVILKTKNNKEKAFEIIEKEEFNDSKEDLNRLSTNPLFSKASNNSIPNDFIFPMSTSKSKSNNNFKVHNKVVTQKSFGIVDNKFDTFRDRKESDTNVIIKTINYNNNIQKKDFYLSPQLDSNFNTNSETANFYSQRNNLVFNNNKLEKNDSFSNYSGFNLTKKASYFESRKTNSSNSKGKKLDFNYIDKYGFKNNKKSKIGHNSMDSEIIQCNSIPVKKLNFSNTQTSFIKNF